MQIIFNFLTVLLLVIILSLEIFPFLKVPKAVVKESQPKKVETYTLTLPGNEEILTFLLKENLSFSYLDGKIYLTLHNKEEFQKILKLYKQTERKLKKIQLASAAVIPLIRRDIKTTQQLLGETLDDYQRLKMVLQNQNMVPDFSQLSPLVVEKQKQTFESYTKYWDLKREQILNGFKHPVEEPQINTADLENKALQFYGNELQAKLFGLYLKLKILETRLEADTYKLKEYGG